jgi:hypothetical protein
VLNASAEGDADGASLDVTGIVMSLAASGGQAEIDIFYRRNLKIRLRALA